MFYLSEHAHKKKHLLQKLLSGVLVEVKAELVKDELVVFVAMEEIVEKLGDTFSILEKDEAACNRLKVGLGQGFVEVYEDAQHLRMIIFFFFYKWKNCALKNYQASELVAEDEVVGNIKGVGEHLCKSSALLQGILKDIEAARFEGDANCLLEFTVLVASQKHALDDGLQASVDHDLRLILGFRLGNTQAAVPVNAFGCNLVLLVSEGRRGGKKKKAYRWS